MIDVALCRSLGSSRSGPWDKDLSASGLFQEAQDGWNLISQEKLVKGIKPKSQNYFI